VDQENDKMDEKLDEKVREWLKWDKNETTRGSIENMVESNDMEMLRECLLTRMAFGTAGSPRLHHKNYHKIIWRNRKLKCDLSLAPSGVSKGGALFWRQ
jgi:replicative superfamily II helicase